MARPVAVDPHDRRRSPSQRRTSPSHQLRRTQARSSVLVATNPQVKRSTLPARRALCPEPWTWAWSPTFSEVPRLAPRWGHQHVAETDNSPVFSIVQADLYIPALTVLDLMSGAGQESVGADAYPVGHVPYWSDLHAYSQIGHTSSFGLLADAGRTVRRRHLSTTKTSIR